MRKKQLINEAAATPAQLNLAQVSSRLAAVTGEEPPPYRVLYNLVLDGLVSATWSRGRWFVNESDLPEIAQKLKARKRARGVQRNSTASTLAA